MHTDSLTPSAPHVVAALVRVSRLGYFLKFNLIEDFSYSHLRHEIYLTYYYLNYLIPDSISFRYLKLSV